MESGNSTSSKKMKRPKCTYRPVSFLTWENVKEESILTVNLVQFCNLALRRADSITDCEVYTAGNERGGVG